MGGCRCVRRGIRAAIRPRAPGVKRRDAPNHRGNRGRGRPASTRVRLYSDHSPELSELISRWCAFHAEYLAAPPHPSPLPYYLHRSVFLRLNDPSEAIQYARRYLMPYVPTQPVLQLITSCLYPPLPDLNTDRDGDVDMVSNGASISHSNGNGNGDMDIDDEGRPGKLKSPYKHESVPLIKMFKEEFCRRHGWPKEEPLEVLVDLGSRGGALNAIEKARRVMGERLGPVRTWTDLPVSVSYPQRNERGLTRRVKSPCQARDDIIRYLSVLSARVRRQRAIRLRCSAVGMSWQKTLYNGCTREGE